MTSGDFGRSIALAALVAALSACTSSNATLPHSSLAGEAGRSVRVSQFADLPGPPAYYFPTAITVGPDHAIWVTDDIDQDFGESAVARINSTGRRTATYYFQNSASPSFEDLAAGSDGALWISDWADGQIVRMTMTGTFTTFSLDGGGPLGVIAGPDRAIWFVENFFGSAAIGRISTNGRIASYSNGISRGAALQDIAVGPDGALWFTESTGDRIGRITTRGKIKEYSAGISPGAEPYSIAPGSDGALWFTEMAGGRIGRITTKGVVTEFSRGITPSEQPVGIAKGRGGMWFTEYEGSYGSEGARVARISPSGKIVEYSGLTPNAGPSSVVRGPDGNMWFVESNADRLARISI